MERQVQEAKVGSAHEIDPVNLVLCLQGLELPFPYIVDLNHAHYQVTIFYVPPKYI